MKPVFQWAATMVAAASATVCLSFSFEASAGQPKATLCLDQAVESATKLFEINHKPFLGPIVSPELVDMNHGEGGYEVWDIHFTNNKGVQFAPYQMTVLIDDCQVIKFEMPTAH